MSNLIGKAEIAAAFFKMMNRMVRVRPKTCVPRLRADEKVPLCLPLFQNSAENPRQCYEKVLSW